MIITVAKKTTDTYKTVVIDPPWKLCTGGKKSLAVHTHYPVQTQDEIIQTVLKWLDLHPMAEESHCYIWCVNSFSAGSCRGILDAVDLCEKIGFKPITLITWKKDNGNPTPYGQRITEMCLFGARWRKGHHKRVMYNGSDDENSVVGRGLLSSIDFIEASRREHSRKPEVFYEYVERRSNPPYLELYSRTNRFNWTMVGNQVGKF
mgnify:CR=1 FL=1